MTTATVDARPKMISEHTTWDLINMLHRLKWDERKRQPASPFMAIIFELRSRPNSGNMVEYYLSNRVREAEEITRLIKGAL